MLITAYNNSGSAIAQGEVVRKTGFSNAQQAATIDLADAASTANAQFLGIADEVILDGTTGDVQISGVFSPIDTSSFSAIDDKVYLSNTPGAISTTPGNISTVVGYVETIGVSGSITISEYSGTDSCATSASTGDQGATGIQGVTGIGSGGGSSTGASNTHNMNLHGLLSNLGALPAVNIGPELIGGAATLVDFRARRMVAGAAGTTTIQLEVNDVAIGGAILSWTAADGASFLKSAVIAVAVIAGDKISFRVTSIESGIARDIYAEVNA